MKTVFIPDTPIYGIGQKVICIEDRVVEIITSVHDEKICRYSSTKTLTSVKKGQVYTILSIDTYSCFTLKEVGLGSRFTFANFEAL